MERCFIISENSKLYHDYMAWRTNLRENCERIRKLSDKMGIEATRCTICSRLGIVATDSDLKKFKNQLTKDPVAWEEGRGIYEFKKNSTVGKAYTALELKIIRQPMVTLYTDIAVHRCQTRLFMYEGVLYATLESDGIKSGTEFPTNWKEMKRSNFYKILEDMEKEEHDEQ